MFAYQTFSTTLAISLGLGIALASYGIESHAASDSVPPKQQTDTARAESRFLEANDAAMTKMMADMSIQPTGEVDRDFVAMMIPHHQGAIDMAMAELREGRNETLRRLAQEIIVTQQEEIQAMRLAVEQDSSGVKRDAPNKSGSSP